MKKLLLIIIFINIITGLSAQSLSVKPEDLYIQQSIEGGYDLWVKNKEGFGSILLTESTADPEKKADSFSLRDPEYNPENGDEKRLLNGKFLDTSQGLYSIIDSTVETNEIFGEAFHLFIPYVVIYGYPWSREGKIQVLDGTYLSIRVFEKPYADYSGGFKDNPFILRVVQKPMEGPPEENYMQDTIDAYTEIAKEGDGEFIFSRGEDDLLRSIKEIIEDEEGDTLDLVLALDTTKSMENDIPYLDKFLIPLLKEETHGFKSFRAGMVLYKDYMEEYLTKVTPFNPNLTVIQNSLDNIKVRGGRDIPEAVYEALYMGIHSFPWEAESRVIILVGDAPPHPIPRGRVTKEMVYRDAENLNIELNTIILPQ